MELEDRIKCAFVLEEIIVDRLLPSDKLQYVNKVLEEQFEIIIELTPTKNNDNE